jgi:hypothetical protein
MGTDEAVRFERSKAMITRVKTFTEEGRDVKEVVEKCKEACNEWLGVEYTVEVVSITPSMVTNSNARYADVAWYVYTLTVVYQFG